MMDINNLVAICEGEAHALTDSNPHHTIQPSSFLGMDNMFQILLMQEL